MAVHMCFILAVGVLTMILMIQLDNLVETFELNLKPVIHTKLLLMVEKEVMVQMVEPVVQLVQPVNQMTIFGTHKHSTVVLVVVKVVALVVMYLTM